MAKFSVIYDACVLYPAPVRDLLMQLALTDLFKARWTDHIHEEWIEALLGRGKYDRKILERTRDCLRGNQTATAIIEKPTESQRRVFSYTTKTTATANGFGFKDL